MHRRLQCLQRLVLLDVFGRFQLRKLKPHAPRAISAKRAGSDGEQLAFEAIIETIVARRRRARETNTAATRDGVRQENAANTVGSSRTIQENTAKPWVAVGTFTSFRTVSAFRRFRVSSGRE